MSLRFIWLNGLLGWLLLMDGALPALARGGGGCFEQGTPVLTPAGPVAIEQLRPGDTVWSLSDGHLQRATVVDCMQVRPPGYYEIRLGDAMLRVTGEHPFQIAPGVFRQAAQLKTGDTVWRWHENQLQPATLASITVVPAGRPAFNLLVSPGGTYFANGFLVHNKGCFLPDTPVMKADGSSVAISAIRPGEALKAFTPEGEVVVTTVRRILTHEVDVYWVLTTDRIMLRVTPEHPFFVGNGEFRTLETLEMGDVIYAFDGQGLTPQTIRSLDRINARTVVYNLQTDVPNTFFANGIAVHNKGGGGGFRSSSGSRSGGSSGDPTWVLFIFIIIVIIILIAAKAQSKKNEDLDYVYSGSEITRKSSKTLQLLQFIAKVDPPYTPEALTVAAKSTFLQLQHCWQARNYEPMKALLMPDLYAAHCGQINGLVRNHEINVIEGVAIEAIDLVNVRYPHAENAREFTALITARARDYYVDDRSQAFLRGDSEPARFQEFWTFQRQNGRWLLREIEQTRESEKLKEENFFETFTDDGLQKVYDQTANEGGPIGPWLEKETATKATRIERLLNFLVLTDKLWNRQAMIERARQTFLQVMLAWESGDPGKLPMDFLFPEIAESHRQGIATLHADGQSVEYRNLCVRKVELVLVRNFKDNNQDEFTARISAHAQYICRKGERILRRDEEVAPFEEFWTFGRRDGQWKLKEIVPSTEGENLIKAENLDEESSAEQLRWFYGKSRAS